MLVQAPAREKQLLTLQRRSAHAFPIPTLLCALGLDCCSRASGARGEDQVMMLISAALVWHRLREQCPRGIDELVGT